MIPWEVIRPHQNKEYETCVPVVNIPNQRTYIRPVPTIRQLPGVHECHSLERKMLISRQ